MDFNRPKDAEFVEDINKVLKQARSTLVERVLLDALKIARTNVPEAVAGAKTDINNQVRSFAAAKILPMVDLHGCIWACAQKVIRNKAF